MTATAENQPDVWEERRLYGEPEPCPTYNHRLNSLWTAVSWCWKAQGLTEQGALLDVAAGAGLVGIFGQNLANQQTVPPFHYAATEQSTEICQFIASRVPNSAVARWRHDPAVGISLRQALAEADATFLPEYPCVIASHVLEHVTDPYGLADHAWNMVKPGGFLILCVPRRDYHRSHESTWNWDRLLAMAHELAGFSQPVVTWEYGSWADLLVAVPKSSAAVPMQVSAHSDDRLNHLVPITSFTEAGDHSPGRAH